MHKLLIIQKNATFVAQITRTNGMKDHIYHISGYSHLNDGEINNIC